MAERDGWDAETFEPEEPSKKPVELDKWEGEDVEDDVKDNWDDEEEELKGHKEKKAATIKSDKKKLSEKIKEKELLEKKEQEELRKELEQREDSAEVSPEEELEAGEPQEDSDIKPVDEAICTSVTNNVSGIDAISPSSKDDFTEFEKLLKHKLSPYEKSVHYSSFLESLFQDLCLSLEIEDLKKINTSITVLLSEKQKQEKQLNKGKKKKKGVVPAGGMKAKMKDDLADYGEFEGGYDQDFEDIM